MAKWQIVEEKPDECNILRGGHIVRYEHGDLAACLKLIKKHRRFDSKADQVSYTPLDGPERVVRKL